jgi:hypothetical protein
MFVNQETIPHIKPKKAIVISCIIAITTLAIGFPLMMTQTGCAPTVPALIGMFLINCGLCPFVLIYAGTILNFNIVIPFTILFQVIIYSVIGYLVMRIRKLISPEQGIPVWFFVFIVFMLYGLLSLLSFGIEFGI